MNSAWNEGEETRNGIVWDGQNPRGGGITKKGRGSAVREEKEQAAEQSWKCFGSKSKEENFGQRDLCFLTSC